MARRVPQPATPTRPFPRRGAFALVDRPPGSAVVTGPPPVTPAIQVGRSSVGSVSSTVPGVRGANAATSPRRSTPMTTAKRNTSVGCGTRASLDRSGRRPPASRRRSPAPRRSHWSCAALRWRRAGSRSTRRPGDRRRSWQAAASHPAGRHARGPDRTDPDAQAPPTRRRRALGPGNGQIAGLGHVGHPPRRVVAVAFGQCGWAALRLVGGGRSRPRWLGGRARVHAGDRFARRRACLLYTSPSPRDS